MGYSYLDGERLRWLLVGLAATLLLLLKIGAWLIYTYRKRRK
ncbi:hypothetical protein ACFQRK_10440 [Parapedobacter sp. GCM10030251]|jgi:hypothetical protein